MSEEVYDPIVPKFNGNDIIKFTNSLVKRGIYSDSDKKIKEIRNKVSSSYKFSGIINEIDLINNILNLCFYDKNPVVVDNIGLENTPIKAGDFIMEDFLNKVASSVKAIGSNHNCYNGCIKNCSSDCNNKCKNGCSGSCFETCNKALSWTKSWGHLSNATWCVNSCINTCIITCINSCSKDCVQGCNFLAK